MLLFQFCITGQNLQSVKYKRCLWLYVFAVSSQVVSIYRISAADSVLNVFVCVCMWLDAMCLEWGPPCERQRGPRDSVAMAFRLSCNWWYSGGLQTENSLICLSPIISGCVFLQRTAAVRHQIHIGRYSRLHLKVRTRSHLSNIAIMIEWLNCVQQLLVIRLQYTKKDSNPMWLINT